MDQRARDRSQRAARTGGWSPRGCTKVPLMYPMPPIFCECASVDRSKTWQSLALSLSGCDLSLVGRSLVSLVGRTGEPTGASRQEPQAQTCEGGSSPWSPLSPCLPVSPALFPVLQCSCCRARPADLAHRDVLEDSAPKICFDTVAAAKLSTVRIRTTNSTHTAFVPPPPLLAPGTGLWASRYTHTHTHTLASLSWDCETLSSAPPLLLFPSTPPINPHPAKHWDFCIFCISFPLFPFSPSSTLARSLFPVFSFPRLSRRRPDFTGPLLLLLRTRAVLETRNSIALRGPRLPLTPWNEPSHLEQERPACHDNPRRDNLPI